MTLKTPELEKKPNRGSRGHLVHVPCAIIVGDVATYVPGDYISRDLFLKHLGDEEEHIDWLETQQQMIDNMGLQNYIQIQSTTA